MSRRRGGPAPATDRAARIAGLIRCVELEEAEGRERDAAAREGHSDRALEASGLLVRRAQVEGSGPAMFGRTLLSLAEDPSRPGHLALFDARPGSVVRVRSAAADELGPLGVVTRTRRARLEIIIDAPLDNGVDTVSLELSSDTVTIGRLRAGLERASDAKGRAGWLVDVALGASQPATFEPAAWTPIDEALNEDQRHAAALGIFATDLALIHGPPGTGKTRVLVEVVRQCLARGERVLCASASNAAVDHLAIQLLAADPAIGLARIGHPARVHEAIERHTLAALTADHPQRKMARRLFDDGHQLIRNASWRSDRAGGAYAKKREARREARTLFAQARELERAATAAVLDRTRVFASTLTGLGTLGPEDGFDVLVVDEASQVLTPALLLAVLRSKRVVLAGDHRQLPPTVLSAAAAKAGYNVTAFDHWMTGAPEVGHMLSVQHRMHADLMAYPSATFYAGALDAHPVVRDLRLGHGGALFDDRPLDVIDTAGAGMDEQAPEDGSSRENPEQAQLVGRLVADLIASGVAASEIGVVTPYAAQRARLSGALADLIDQGLEVDSVDGFQGREKTVIVFDAVRSNATGDVGFCADPRRLNVAITRAKQKLFVVADSATLGSNARWSALFDHAMATGGYRSVFELPPA